MATFPLGSLNVPDAAVPRILAGLRKHFGPVEDPVGSGLFRDLTQAEIAAKLRQLVVDSVRNMVVNQEVATATQDVKTSYETLGVS